MESLEINSTQLQADYKQNNDFIDLSLSPYNRHTHDTSMQIMVKCMDVMVSIESLIDSANDKNRLVQLIGNGILSILSGGLVAMLHKLPEEVEISNPKIARYKDIGYYILRHLRDYHLKQFQQDSSSGRLQNILKVKVEKGNVVIQLHLKHVIDNVPVSYGISLMYWVLMHLYHRLYPNRHVDDIRRKVFDVLNPIVTKFHYTMVTVADDNYSWFSQLQQLKSNQKFLVVSSKNNQVQFRFRPQTHPLASTLYCPVENTKPSDTNYQNRFVDYNIALKKDGSIETDVLMVGKDFIDSTFGFYGGADELAELFGNLSDNDYIYLCTYNILKRLLSFTKQHNKNISRAFKGIEANNDDRLLQKVLEELEKVGQKNNQVAYAITIMELLGASNEEINTILSALDYRTATKIKDVIASVSDFSKANRISLNQFYRYMTTGVGHARYN